MNRVDGKVALVTGAAKGIGRACAELLAAEGAAVVATDREAALVAEVVNGIRKVGGNAVFVAHDVTNETQWSRAVDDALQAFGKLDVLVNNAGVGRAGDVEHETLQSWRDLMAINLDGVFLGIKHAIPPMRDAGGGSIINLSSIEGLIGDPSLAAYNASKGGVRLLTKSAALYCAKGGRRFGSTRCIRDTSGRRWSSSSPKRRPVPTKRAARSSSCTRLATSAKRWTSRTACCTSRRTNQNS